MTRPVNRPLGIGLGLSSLNWGGKVTGIGVPLSRISLYFVPCLRNSEILSSISISLLSHSGLWIWSDETFDKVLPVFVWLKTSEGVHIKPPKKYNAIRILK